MAKICWVKLKSPNLTTGCPFDIVTEGQPSPIQSNHRKHTTIPVPRVIKVYICGKKQYLAMDAVDGQTLGSAWPDLTEEQRPNITAFVQQLRGLVLPEEGTVGSTSLGPSYDHRLGDRHFGPFNNIADFHFYIRRDVPLEFWNEPIK
ncbi:hypothetical protein McaMca56_007415 [Microsporum canis]